MVGGISWSALSPEGTAKAERKVVQFFVLFYCVLERVLTLSEPTHEIRLFEIPRMLYLRMDGMRWIGRKIHILKNCHQHLMGFKI